MLLNDGGDTYQYEWKCDFESDALGRPDPCFPGKRPITQRQVSEKRDPVFYAPLAVGKPAGSALSDQI